MPGGYRRAIAGGAVFGLLAAGLFGVSLTAPAHAAPTTCAMADNSEMTASLDTGYPGQIASGTWTDVGDDTVTRTWFGLYDAASAPDPDHSHLGPHQQDFGGTATLPPTPVQTGDHFQWRIRGLCKESNTAFYASGQAWGSCYRATGLGAGTIGTKAVTVRWELAGTQLVLLDPSATGTITAQLKADTNDSCTNGTATDFLLTGAVAGAG